MGCHRKGDLKLQLLVASDQVQVDSYNSTSCFSKKCFLESSQHGG